MAKNILVCDDAAFMRMMIKDILTKNGYNVAGEAENGLKAVEKYKEVTPDLVLMDITMPEMDGIQALKEIKKVDAAAKIIMCSAMGQQAMVIESIQAGAKDFIVKPFQPERVLEAVKKLSVNVAFGYKRRQLCPAYHRSDFVCYCVGNYGIYNQMDCKLSETAGCKRKHSSDRYRSNCE